LPEESEVFPSGHVVELLLPVVVPLAPVDGTLVNALLATVVPPGVDELGLSAKGTLLVPGDVLELASVPVPVEEGDPVTVCELLPDPVPTNPATAPIILFPPEPELDVLTGSPKGVLAVPPAVELLLFAPVPVANVLTVSPKGVLDVSDGLSPNGVLAVPSPVELLLPAPVPVDDVLTVSPKGVLDVSDGLSPKGILILTAGWLLSLNWVGK